MCRELLHIYGPFSIYSYGLMIFIGLSIIILLMLHDPVRKQVIKSGQLLDTLTCTLLSGIIGARIFYILCNWDSVKTIVDIVAIWDGGLSLMGAIAGILISLPFYLHSIDISISKFIDLLVVYIPLLQSFGRIGCFFAGCCYGSVTKMPWGICHFVEDSDITLHYSLHPTQLYSAFLLFILFLFFKLYARRVYVKSGQLIMLYLIFVGLERFFIDFFRGDREFFANQQIAFLSIHQYCALFIVILGFIGMIIVSKRQQLKVYEHI